MEIVQGSNMRVFLFWNPRFLFAPLLLGAAERLGDRIPVNTRDIQVAKGPSNADILYFLTNVVF